MQALVTIKKCDNPRPIIDTSTKIRKYYISAENRSWDGQLRYCKLLTLLINPALVGVN